MIIPCIDLMDGKVVQLVQGREKALEGGTPAEMLERFKAFPEIQVIDLDAALSRGENDAIVEFLAARAKTRVGGGVRSVERARKLLQQGARKIIIGTAAFDSGSVNTAFLEEVTGAIGRVGTPEEIAKALAWLASDEASFVNAAPIFVDGGLLARL